MTTAHRKARFESLVDQVGDPLRRYLGRRLQPADADEVLGDVLLVLWRRIDDVPGDDPLPWCFGVARRALANRRRGQRRAVALIERLRGVSAPAMVDPAGAGEYPELVAALADLPASDRDVLVLWAWEQLEPREIAVVLGTTPNAASLRLSRARRKLAARLGVTGDGPSRTGMGHKDTRGAG